MLSIHTSQETCFSLQWRKLKCQKKESVCLLLTILQTFTFLVQICRIWLIAHSLHDLFLEIVLYVQIVEGKQLHLSDNNYLYIVKSLTVNKLVVMYELFGRSSSRDVFQNKRKYSLKQSKHNYVGRDNTYINLTFKV